jgi:hypothetical protein
MIARIASNTRWAYERERFGATAAARRGLEAKFEREVDPAGVLPPAERAERVASLKRAHYLRLAMLSAEARRRGT